MSDGYQNYGSSPSNPARTVFSVTLSDGADQATVCKAFRSNAAGTVRLTAVDFADGAYFDHPVLAGETISLMVKRFWTTGTTAGLGLIGYAG